MEFNFDEPDMLGKIDAMGNPNGYTATASALEKALTILQDGLTLQNIYTAAPINNYLFYFSQNKT